MQLIQKFGLLLVCSLALMSNVHASNDPIIVAHPTSVMQGIGGQAVLKVAVSENLNAVYQWQKSFDEVNWLDIQAANQATYKPQSQEIGKTWYRVLITTQEENARAVASKMAVVTIVETPQARVEGKE